MIKTFLAELKYIFRSKKWRPWEWLFITIIPFLYGFLYMNAYWSPFSKTENLKIAVVNLDQSDESKLFVNKIVDKGEKGFDIGSKNYKFNIYDASSIYTPSTSNDISEITKAADEGLEKAKKLVDDGKYHAVIIIDRLFTFNRREIKNKLIAGIEENINRISDPNEPNRALNLSEIASDLHSTIQNSIYSTPDSPQGNQLITFYNSYKNSYLAGEMTNFGAGLSSLEIDSIIPTEDEFVRDILGLKSLTQAEELIQFVKLLNIFPVSLTPSITKSLDLQTIDFLKLANEFNQEIKKNPAMLGQIMNAITDPTLKGIAQNLFMNLSTPSVSVAIERLANDPTLITSMLHFIRLATNGGLSVTNDSLSIGSNINAYGFGLAPYFMCIALWAGSLVMLFLIKNDRHIKDQSTLKHYFGKSMVWVLTSWIQALILATAITLQGVNIGFAHQWELFALALFIATIFSLTVQGVGYAFRYGDMADFAAVILLVIQLVSSSGTFPVDMQWGIFRVIHPVIPFTYAINAIREIFFDPNMGVLFQNLGILLAFPVVAMSVSIAINYWFDRKTVVKHHNGTFEFKSYEIHLDDH